MPNPHTTDVCTSTTGSLKRHHRGVFNLRKTGANVIHSFKLSANIYY